MLRSALVFCLVCHVLTAAEGGPKAGFANFTVSQRVVALNQPVRVQFTTLPRQIPEIDIARTVRQALDASRQAGHWRPIGEPQISEHEKTHTITIAFTVLPRKVGEIPLPRVPLTWISADQLAEFGLVTIAPQIAIGAESKELPKEISGIAGWLWGMRLDEAKAQLPPEAFVVQGDAVVVQAQPGLALSFRDGALVEARLTSTGLPLARARDSFTSRWGQPQIETADRLTWILGWTRIEAAPAADGNGVILDLVREDVQAALDRVRTSREVFDVLDGSATTPAAPAAPTEEERRQEAERELQRVLGQ